MTRPSSTFLVALALVLGGVHPDTSRLVLRASDLGSTFTGRGAHVSNADAVRATPGMAARLAHWGRVDGYDVVLTRRSGSLQDGPLEVESSASLFTGASGAHRAIAYASRHLVPVGYVPLALGFAIGRDARQWVRQGESGVGTMLQYLLVWRERNVDASIVITGRVGVVSAADVAPLARRQEARILRAL